MARLTKFSNGLRVKIVEHENDHLIGECGNVVRLRHADDGAWVRMDGRLPCDDFPFSVDDSRSNHTMLYLEQCEKV